MTYRDEEQEWEEIEGTDVLDESEEREEVWKIAKNRLPPRERTPVELEIVRQYVQPWYDATDNEAKQMVMEWACEANSHGRWVVDRVLDEKFFGICRRIVREDEPIAATAFDQCLQKIREEVLGKRVSKRRGKRNKKPYVFQGKRKFLAFSKRIVRNHCITLYRKAKREKEPPICPPIRLEQNLLEAIGLETRATLEEKIPNQGLSPEKTLENQEVDEEFMIRVRRFIRSLSPGYRKTLMVRLQILREAAGPVSDRELNRRTREILGISANALDIRMHRIRLEAAKYIGRPPDSRKKGPTKRKRE